jgi:two-component system chemotaxis response regulator CheB
MRVVLFNDSPTARAHLVAALSGSGELEVLAYASAEDAVEIVRRDRPHVVLMDVVMPGKDGFVVTREIMAKQPVPIVLVSAIVDTADPSVVLEALASGALCIVDAPAGPTAPDFEQQARRLVHLVRTMAQARPHGFRHATPVPSPPVSRGLVQAVGVVASAGGPPALMELLSALPRDFPPLLVVQHLPPGFVASFASWLGERTSRPVSVAEGGPIRRGMVYVAPPDGHLELTAPAQISISRGALVHGFRPSGSVLLHSLARTLGPRGLGVVLTGMGADGSDGAAALKQSGGKVVVQERASAAVHGMPTAAVAADGVSLELPLEQIGPWLTERCGAP